MKTYCHITKQRGEWTEDGMKACADAMRKAEKKFLQKRAANGVLLKNIAAPLPDLKHLKKYSKDTRVKKFLEPYQTINPLKLKQQLD